jgi:hypothetical protein
MDTGRVLVPLPPGGLIRLGLHPAEDGPLLLWPVGREALMMAGEARALAETVSAVTRGFALWLDGTQTAGLCLAGVRIGDLGADPYFDFLALADQLVGAFAGALESPDPGDVQRWTSTTAHRPAAEFPRSLIAFASGTPPALSPGWHLYTRSATTWSPEFTVAERVGPLDADAVGALARGLGAPAVGVELRAHDSSFGWLWCDWAGEITTGEAEGCTALLNLWEDFGAQVGERAGALVWR